MENSTTEKKQRAKRTPRNSDSVTKGALALPLAERVQLKKDLQDSIDAEVETLAAAAEQAKKLSQQ